MGNRRQALLLIIEKLGDVTMAIEFAKDQNDPDLWEEFMNYSVDKPEFIEGLVMNVGCDVDLSGLIERIPDNLQVPNLKKGLVKMFGEYHNMVCNAAILLLLSVVPISGRCN